MNWLDYTILHWLSASWLHPPGFEQFVESVQHSHLLKGGVMMAAIWGLWFGAPSSTDALEGDKQVSRVRRRIIAGFCAAFLATGIVRAVHLSLPYRPRPMNYPAMFGTIQSLTDKEAEYGRNDSSFPSDHATLFYALATLILLVSPRLGIASFIYVTVVIALPRFYLLIHYPTDVIVGGAIGSICVWSFIRLSDRDQAPKSIFNLLLGLSKSAPSAFYAMMFVWSFCVAEIFDSVRDLARVGPVLRAMLNH